MYACYNICMHAILYVCMQVSKTCIKNVQSKQRVSRQQLLPSYKILVPEQLNLKYFYKF